jgi:hypothetical protein
MIIFEDQLARIVEVLPPLTNGTLTQKINFGWGTEEVLTKFLTMAGKLSFPLIWLAEGEDSNNLREPSVKRNARIIILYESQAPSEFNAYQHEYDYNVILQPILDNLLIALTQSGISRYDNTTFRTRRVKNYNVRETETESLVFICNAIVLNSDITFSGISNCINTNIDFNN